MIYSEIWLNARFGQNSKLNEKTMSNLLSRRCITFSILFIIGALGVFSRSVAPNTRSLDPNKLMVDKELSVIDTVRAREVYETKLPGILSEQTELKEKYSVCQKLIQSKKKKVESDTELQLLKKAYEYAREHAPMREVYDKNVEKGKLTSDVKSSLSIYADHLQRKIDDLENAMNNNWLSFVTDLPKKFVTVQTKNRNYRGYHYDNYDTLNDIEEGKMMKNYEFLLTDKGKLVEESYPVSVTYKRYANLPNLRVIDHSDTGPGYAIYDNKGQLVYVPRLQRQDLEDVYPISVTKEIRRLIYKRDYQNNKYGVQSESSGTKAYLDLFIGRPKGLTESVSERNGLKLTLSLAAECSLYYGINISAETERQMNEMSSKLKKYSDAVGEKYISQLEKDHADDFGYLYVIERLGDTQFLIVYLNKNTLLPSVCGIVTFFTGDKPYTTDFSVQLCEIPNDVPPVIPKEKKIKMRGFEPDLDTLIFAQ